MLSSECLSGSQTKCREFIPTEQATKILKMQATIGCLSRIVSRTLVNNVVNGKESASSNNSQHSPRSCPNSGSSRSVSTAAVESCDSVHDHARLLTAVSGFPKSQTSYNIDHILKVK